MLREARDIREVSSLDADQGIQCQQTSMDEGIGMLLLDPGYGGQCVNGSGDLFLKSDADLLLRIDVNLPPGEYAGEAGVLATASDGQ